MFGRHTPNPHDLSAVQKLPGKIGAAKHSLYALSSPAFDDRRFSVGRRCQGLKLPFLILLSIVLAELEVRKIIHRFVSKEYRINFRETVGGNEAEVIKYEAKRA